MAKVVNVSNRDLYKEALEQLTKKDLILDLGGGHPYSSLGEYKQMFRTVDKYYCFAIDADCRPHIIGDIPTLPFKSESVENIICVSVLEHVPEPQKVVNEIHRILKPGGMILLVIPFVFPYHSIDHDYYRFTKDGIGHLFRHFREVHIQPRGNYVDTTLRFMSGFTTTGTKFLYSIKPLFVIIAKLYVGQARKRNVSLHGHEQSVLFYNVICLK